MIYQNKKLITLTKKSNKCFFLLKHYYEFENIYFAVFKQRLSLNIKLKFIIIQFKSLQNFVLVIVIISICLF